MALRISTVVVAFLLIGRGWMAAENRGAQQLFNGSTLTGWSADAGQWRVENGEIVGATNHSEAAWLTLKKSYEDTVLEATFRCTDCEAGVMLRKAPVKNNTDQYTGLYLSLSGPDSPSVYRLTLDKQGKELSHEFLVLTTQFSINAEVVVVMVRRIADQRVSTNETLEPMLVGGAARHSIGFVDDNPRETTSLLKEVAQELE